MNSEQPDIVRRVEGLFALADQFEAQLAKACGQVEQLTPTLPARAIPAQPVGVARGCARKSGNCVGATTAVPG